MLGILGKRKATPVLGLDISSTTVKLLELSYSGDRYRVESYAVSSLPHDAVIEKNVNDVDGVANAVRSVVAHLQHEGEERRGSGGRLLGDHQDHRYARRPRDDDMETQLTLEADQYIPYPLEEVAIDFEVQGPRRNGRTRWKCC